MIKLLTKFNQKPVMEQPIIYGQKACTRHIPDWFGEKNYKV